MNTFNEKEFYQILGLNQNASIEEIDQAISDYFNASWGSKHNHTTEELSELQNILSFYEIIKKTPKVEEKPKETVIKVKYTKKKEVETISDKAKKIIKSKSLRNIILIIIAATTIGLTAKSVSNNNKKNKKPTDVTQPTSSPVMQMETTSETADIIQELPPQQEMPEQEMPEQETIDKVNDQKIITEKAIKLWDKVKENEELIRIFNSEESCLEVIKWAHHSEPTYQGEYSISNNDAYFLLSSLYQNDIAISQLFEGLEEYENLKNIENALKNLNENNNNLDDEYNLYQILDAASTNFVNKNTQNYSAAIAYSLYTNNILGKGTMTMARGVQEGNNNPQYISGNNDYKTLQSTLESEKQQECRAIFDKLFLDPQDYSKGLITKLIDGAYEEDDNFYQKGSMTK